jgi:hypothetical protein
MKAVGRAHNLIIFLCVAAVLLVALAPRWFYIYPFLSGTFLRLSSLR